MQDAFSHVTTWVFDLDNTLYHPSARLFDQIEVKMNDYVMRELGVDASVADKLRTEYWRDYGTTLAGMMAHHDIDPNPYLVEVHDIDLSHIPNDPIFAKRIANLRGRKIVYTNGSQFHAERVTKARGIFNSFHAMYGSEHAEFIPKPEKEAFDLIIERDGFVASKAVMFEDDVRNLEAPKELGMMTVYVTEGSPHVPDYVDYVTTDLSTFLNSLST
jgi:putative hydrolase of the HAD superfamily